MNNNFDQFEQKMAHENVHPLVIKTFQQYYQQLCDGNQGLILEKDISPVDENKLHHYGDLSEYAEKGQHYLKQATMIKLNGGLGTSMGLSGPKCLLPVKGDHTFFDITAGQIQNFNSSIDGKMPFVLMNSFRTEQPTQELLQKYPDLLSDIPSTFVQNKYPKVDVATKQPANYPQDREHEWNPPGHGDVYLSLLITGILDKLLANNIHYAFISNIDNLGASMDLSLLGYFAEKNLPFMMEVVARTEMDKKGGHIAQYNENGRLILRESAQASANEIDQFQDYNRYSYFNSNNIWVNLRALKEAFDNNDNQFLLPLILNQKNVNPTDKSSDKVYQLESAMGAAISLFDNTEAVVITKERFRPVKKFDDLLILWSDRCTLTSDFRLDFSHNNTPITVVLDPDYYSKLDQFTERFPYGAPSLENCQSLTIKGDVVFGKNVTIKGNVTIENRTNEQQRIEDNAQIESSVLFN